MNEKRISRLEAATLLEACLPLVHKLTDHGFNFKQIDLNRALDPGLEIGIELTEQDRTALAGFNKLWANGWLTDPELPRQAGVKRIEINALSFIATMIRVKEVAKLPLSREEMGDSGCF